MNKLKRFSKKIWNMLQEFGTKMKEADLLTEKDRKLLGTLGKKFAQQNFELSDWEDDGGKSESMPFRFDKLQSLKTSKSPNGITLNTENNISSNDANSKTSNVHYPVSSQSVINGCPPKNNFSPLNEIEPIHIVSPNLEVPSFDNAPSGEVSIKEMCSKDSPHMLIKDKHLVGKQETFHSNDIKLPNTNHLLSPARWTVNKSFASSNYLLHCSGEVTNDPHVFDDCLDVSVSELNNLKEQLCMQTGHFSPLSPLPPTPPPKHVQSDRQKENKLNPKLKYSRFMDKESATQDQMPCHAPSKFGTEKLLNHERGHTKKKSLCHQQSKGVDVADNVPADIPDQKPKLFDKINSEMTSIQNASENALYRLSAKRCYNGTIKLDFNIGKPIDLEVNPNNWNVSCTFGPFDEAEMDNRDVLNTSIPIQTPKTSVASNEQHSGNNETGFLTSYPSNNRQEHIQIDKDPYHCHQNNLKNDIKIKTEVVDFEMADSETFKYDNSFAADYPEDNKQKYTFCQSGTPDMTPVKFLGGRPSNIFPQFSIPVKNENEFKSSDCPTGVELSNEELGHSNDLTKQSQIFDEEINSFEHGIHFQSPLSEKKLYRSPDKSIGFNSVLEDHMYNRVVHSSGNVNMHEQNFAKSVKTEKTSPEKMFLPSNTVNFDDFKKPKETDLKSPKNNLQTEQSSIFEKDGNKKTQSMSLSHNNCSVKRSKSINSHSETNSKKNTKQFVNNLFSCSPSKKACISPECSENQETTTTFSKNKRKNNFKKKSQDFKPTLNTNQIGNAHLIIKRSKSILLKTAEAKSAKRTRKGKSAYMRKEKLEFNGRKDFHSNEIEFVPSSTNSSMSPCKTVVNDNIKKVSEPNNLKDNVISQMKKDQRSTSESTYSQLKENFTSSIKEEGNSNITENSNLINTSLKIKAFAECTFTNKGRTPEETSKDCSPEKTNGNCTSEKSESHTLEKVNASCTPKTVNKSYTLEKSIENHTPEKTNKSCSPEKNRSLSPEKWDKRPTSSNSLISPKLLNYSNLFPETDKINESFAGKFNKKSNSYHLLTSPKSTEKCYKRQNSSDSIITSEFVNHSNLHITSDNSQAVDKQCSKQLGSDSTLSLHKDKVKVNTSVSVENKTFDCSNTEIFTEKKTDGVESLEERSFDERYNDNRKDFSGWELYPVDSFLISSPVDSNTEEENPSVVSDNTEHLKKYDQSEKLNESDFNYSDVDEHNLVIADDTVEYNSSGPSTKPNVPDHVHPVAGLTDVENVSSKTKQEQKTAKKSPKKKNKSKVDSVSKNKRKDKRKSKHSDIDNWPVSPIQAVFESVEKLKYSDSHFNQHVHRLISVLINPANAPDATAVLLHIIQYLCTSRRIPLMAFSMSKESTVLLPLIEKCIITALLDIEKKKKTHLAGLLQSAINSLYVIILSQTKLNLYSVSSLCRVFTGICMLMDNKRKLLMLCCDILKIPHKFGPYLIASIAGVWKELFQVSVKSSGDELVFYESLGYALSKKPKVLSDTQWKHCCLIFSEYVTIPCVIDVNEASEYIMQIIEERCLNGLDEDMFKLTSPLVFFAVFEGWTWTKKSLIEPFIQPALTKYAKEIHNDKAFALFCNLYGDICLMNPEAYTDPVLLELFAVGDNGFPYVKETAALVLVKVCALKKLEFPSNLTNWMAEHGTKLSETSVELTLRRRIISDGEEINEECIVV